MESQSQDEPEQPRPEGQVTEQGKEKKKRPPLSKKCHPQDCCDCGDNRWHRLTHRWIYGDFFHTNVAQQGRTASAEILAQLSQDGVVSLTQALGIIVALGGFLVVAGGAVPLMKDGFIGRLLIRLGGCIGLLRLLFAMSEAYYFNGFATPVFHTEYWVETILATASTWLSKKDMAVCPSWFFLIRAHKRDRVRSFGVMKSRPR